MLELVLNLNLLVVFCDLGSHNVSLLLWVMCQIRTSEVAAFVFRSAATNSSCSFTVASSSLLLLFSNWITPYKTAICLYSAQFHEGFYAMDSH